MRTIEMKILFYSGLLFIVVLTGCSHSKSETICDDADTMELVIFNRHRYSNTKIRISKITDGLSYDSTIFKKRILRSSLRSKVIKPKQYISWTLIDNNLIKEREEFLELSIWRSEVIIWKPAASTTWIITYDKPLTFSKEVKNEMGQQHYILTLVDPSRLSDYTRKKTPDFIGKRTIKKIIKNMGSKSRPF